MTALRNQAETVADLLVEVSRRDPRRGVVVETVLAAQLLDQGLLAAETLELLAHRAANQPAAAVRPIERKLKDSYLSDVRQGAAR